MKWILVLASVCFAVTGVIAQDFDSANHNMPGCETYLASKTRTNQLWAEIALGQFRPLSALDRIWNQSIGSAHRQPSRLVNPSGLSCLTSTEFRSAVTSLFWIWRWRHFARLGRANDA